jgi:transposase
MAKRQQFTTEFKVEAVRLWKSSGRPAAAIARELGLRRNHLYKWQLELETHGEAAFPGKGGRAHSTDELTRLRRENARLREERDILKKAAVGSSDQRNTIWGTVELEGDRDGIYGTSGLVRGPESGSVAAVETRAVIERDRPGTRQTRGLDSWRGILERRIHSSRSEPVALGADIGRARRNFAWHGNGFFNPADRGPARSSAVDHQPGNPPPWWGPQVSGL